MGHVLGIDTTYTGNPVSFNAAYGGTIKSVSVPIAPTQDLHGYSNPWPAGGGVNKFDEEMVLGILNNDGTVSSSTTRLVSKNFIPITAETQYSMSWDKPGSSTARARGAFYDSTETFLSYTGDLGSTPTEENGRLVTQFTTPQGAAYLKICMYTSYGTTYKNDITIGLYNASTNGKYYPYSNICPISGLTGLMVYRTGKNLLPLIDGTYAVGSTGATAVVADGSITITGGTTTSGGRTTRLSDYFILKAGTYIISPVVTSPYIRGYLNKRSDNSAIIYSSGNPFTLTEDTEVYYGVGLEGGKTYNATIYPQLELGSTATTYEPYNGNTYAVDWSTQAGTVYHGTVDVVTGVLTVDWAYALLNDPSQWAASSGTVNFIYNTSYSDRKKYDNSYDGIICSYMVVSSAGQNTITARWTGATSNFFGLRWVGGTLDQVKADAQENKIAIVYELATPLTYQLTPKQIAALIGQNYIWSSNNQTLNTVLTAPATGFAGWLIKCVTNGTPVEIPLKYMRAETYTVTPDQRMEWSAERDVTGVLHRETVQNLPPKIEFNTPLMTNSDINALNSIIKAAFTSYLQRNITIQFYDPERNEYWEWDCYMPDVKYHIRNADTVNNIINYEELRYAFIGY